jgi:hypothetical protein
MAHFAELDINNRVIDIRVISNDFVNANGGDLSISAEQAVLADTPLSPNGIKYKQTSYHGNFRKNYAAINVGIYDEEKDAFYLENSPQPSWVFNESTCKWEPSIAYPTITKYNVEPDPNNPNIENGQLPYLIYWKEADLRWEAKDYNNTKTYIWDINQLNWIILS